MRGRWNHPQRWSERFNFKSTDADGSRETQRKVISSEGNPNPEETFSFNRKRSRSHGFVNMPRKKDLYVWKRKSPTDDLSKGSNIGSSDKSKQIIDKKVMEEGGSSVQKKTDQNISQVNCMDISTVHVDLLIPMAQAIRKYKNYVIVKFATACMPAKEDFEAEIKRLWQGNMEWDVIPFTNDQFLVKIVPTHILNTLVAQGIYDSKFGKLLVRNWSGMEGSFIEKRDRKIWIKLKKMPIHSWDFTVISKLVKGFGDLIMLDDLSQDGSQLIEAIVQIACASLSNILLILRAFIADYAYEIAIDIIGEVVEIRDEKNKKLKEIMHKDHNYSEDSSWDWEGEESPELYAGTQDEGDNYGQGSNDNLKSVGSAKQVGMVTVVNDGCSLDVKKASFILDKDFIQKYEANRNIRKCSISDTPIMPLELTEGEQQSDDHEVFAQDLQLIVQESSIIEAPIPLAEDYSEHLKSVQEKGKKKNYA